MCTVAFILFVVLGVLAIVSAMSLLDSNTRFDWLVEHWALKPFTDLQATPDSDQRTNSTSYPQLCVQVHIASSRTIFNGTHWTCPAGSELMATMMWPGTKPLISPRNTHPARPSHT